MCFTRNATRLVLVVVVLIFAASCVREQPQVIVITATFPTELEVVQPAEPAVITEPATPTLPPLQLSPVPDQPAVLPTLDPVRPPVEMANEHVVQPGETLSLIAQRYNVTLDSILSVNTLANPNLLSVGQVLALPAPPGDTTPVFKIIPDSRLVRAPGSAQFDIAAFVARQPGYIRNVVDRVTTRRANGTGLDMILTAAQVVERVSLEYSVDPRILLAILEYRAGWLSNPLPPEELRTHPLISADMSPGFDRSGLYRQLAWLANELNRGYYGWKYRGSVSLEFGGGPRLAYGDGLNAGTIGVQYALSRGGVDYARWFFDVGPDGLYRKYYAYFGDPFQNAIEPLIPPDLTQPELTLPFRPGEIWYFTGGHHGGWGSGSAWAALDFAPPDDRTGDPTLCYTSETWVTAVAPGIIARSGDGSVILDLDGDGDEATGWSILYLHVAEEDRIPAGTRVAAGDFIGRASCAGGFSTATHLHIGRRYNGEWLPADCQECIPGQEIPAFVMSGWRSVGLRGQEYQGYMRRDNIQLQAEQGRLSPINHISW